MLSTSDGAAGKRTLRVLFVDDRQEDCELSVRALEAAGFACAWERVEERQPFLAKLDEADFDVVLCDYRMPRFDGLAALALFVEKDLAQPFILISGTLGEEQAIEAMKAGATDYVLKDRLGRLAPVVGRALREAAERSERRRAQLALREEAVVSEALARAGRELMGELSEPGLVGRLGRVVLGVLRAEIIETHLLDEATGAFRRVHRESARGAPSAIVPPLIPSAAWRDLVQRMAGEEVVEVASAGAAGGDASFPRGVLCMALRRGETLIGAQVAGASAENPFGAPERRIAAGIAQLASIALEHARVLDELERANRLKSDFVATMSHELRTPLHIILGYTDLLLAETFGVVPSEQVMILERIAHSAHRLHELVRWTLDLSRLEAGRLPVRVEPVDLGELVATVLAEERELHPKAEVTVSAAVPDHLPFVFTDREKLALALRNLVDNAVKFTPAGTVEVEASTSEREVAISVRDTGIGVPPEARERIFESFVQLEDVQTRHHEGAGLGLHVAQRLVELLGGRIDLESELGRGSTFRIHLPQPLRGEPRGEPGKT